MRPQNDPNNPDLAEGSEGCIDFLETYDQVAILLSLRKYGSGKLMTR